MRTDMRRKIDGPIYFKTRVSTNSVCPFLNRFNPIMEYMLSAGGGLKGLQDMGQPPFIPCRVTSQAIQDVLPGNLPKLVEVRE